MACLERFPGENVFSLKEKEMESQLRSAHNCKTYGTMSFGQTRQKWRCLAIYDSTNTLSSTVLEG